MKQQTRKLLQIVIVFALALSLMPVQPALAQDADIVDTAVAAGSFNTLVTAVQAAGLVDTLRAKGRSPSLRPPTRRLPSCRRQCSRRRWLTQKDC